MKKLLLVYVISLTTLNYSSPRCIGQEQNQHFRKSALQRVKCSCPCTYRSAHVDKYECLECKHRLLPEILVDQKKIVSDEQTKLALSKHMNTFIVQKLTAQK